MAHQSLDSHHSTLHFTRPRSQSTAVSSTQSPSVDMPTRYKNVSLTFENSKGALRDALLKTPTVYLFGKRLKITYRHPRPPFSQCSKCQALGHASKGCKAASRCAHCDGQHRTQDHRARCKLCAQEGIPAETDCPHLKKCHNCGGRHEAMDIACPKRRKYRPVQTPPSQTEHMDEEEL